MHSSEGKKTVAYPYNRMSNATQRHGASLPRQQENAARYATEKGYILNTTLSLNDIGVSGYRGKNATEGALSCFLEAVRTGKIARGSVLLIEHLDRLSRNDVPTALELFLSLLRAGIRIATISDRMEYSHESVAENPMQLMISIVYMIRANEESRTKANRVADAWERRRKRAVDDGAPITKKCPAWLEVVEGEYRTREDRVKIVIEVMERLANGEGQHRIASDLTKRNVKPWGGAKIWHTSYLQLLATNRALIGDCQLYRGDGKEHRIPVGEPLPDYFPHIISKDLFYRVQAARNARRVHKLVGRQGDRITNLFQGLVYDNLSGRRCTYSNHGKWQYIAPQMKAKTQKAWPYAHFEKTFLTHCRMIDWNELFAGSTKEAVTLTRTKLESLRAEVSQFDTQIARLVEIVAESPDVLSIVERLRVLEKKRATLIPALALAEQEYATSVSQKEALGEDAQRIRALASGALIDRESRLRLREEIRRTVSRIDVSFSKRGGFSMWIRYSNGAQRFIRPMKGSDKVRITDLRECGFIGTPEQWEQGAGQLPCDPDLDIISEPEP